ncbi:hypothetical protein D1872_88300 [compost metagenome]
MLDFDKIMNFTVKEATYKAAHRIKDQEKDFLTEMLDPEMKQIVEQNHLTFIIIEEMVKAGLKQYHEALQLDNASKS